MDQRFRPNRFVNADLQALIETQPKLVDRLVTAIYLVLILVAYGLAGANDMEEAKRTSLGEYINEHAVVTLNAADWECK